MKIHIQTEQYTVKVSLFEYWLTQSPYCQTFELFVANSLNDKLQISKNNIQLGIMIFKNSRYFIIHVLILYCGALVNISLLINLSVYFMETFHPTTILHKTVSILFLQR